MKLLTPFGYWCRGFIVALVATPAALAVILGLRGSWALAAVAWLFMCWQLLGVRTAQDEFVRAQARNAERDTLLHRLLDEDEARQRFRRSGVTARPDRMVH
jgi:hypothetical protein